MKSITVTIFFFSIFLAFSCKQEPIAGSQEACIEQFLETFDMKSYNGGDIDCGDNYLVLFQNDETFYSILHNDCADLLPTMLVDCQGNELCVYVTDEGCFEMVQASNNLGIIGVE